jgi:hypothetical protein
MAIMYTWKLIQQRMCCTPDTGKLTETAWCQKVHLGISKHDPCLKMHWWYAEFQVVSYHSLNCSSEFCNPHYNSTVIWHITNTKMPSKIALHYCNRCSFNESLYGSDTVLYTPAICLELSSACQLNPHTCSRLSWSIHCHCACTAIT